jgi:hypothetical protein
MKAKADHIVTELGRCQQENGGEWAGSIPTSTWFDPRQARLGAAIHPAQDVDGPVRDVRLP